MTRAGYRRMLWAGGALMVVAVGAVIALRQGVDLPAWAQLTMILAVFAGATAFTIGWWKLLDEVAKEAHKFAWYWGGSAGLTVAGAVMLLVDSARIPVPHMILSGQHTDFTVGAATVMFAQLAGYAVAWVGWWWSHR
jgi:hypothetical protein